MRCSDFHIRVKAGRLVTTPTTVGERLVAETGRPGVDRSYRYDELDRLVEEEL